MCCVLLFLTFFVAHGYAQSTREAYLFSSAKEPLVNAAVFDQNTRFGTISDARGYVRINGVKDEDTILISHLGFKTLKIRGRDLQDSLFLETDIVQLEEIAVRPKESQYDLARELYQVFNVNKGLRTNLSAKANLVAESFIGQLPLERMEAIGNIQYQNSSAASFDLIMGRFGQNRDINFFTLSLDGLLSKAPPYSAAADFPQKITEQSYRRIFKEYALSLKSDDGRNRIIEFKTEHDNSFSGEIEYEKKTRRILVYRYYLFEQNFGLYPIGLEDNLQAKYFEYVLKFSRTEGHLEYILFNYTLDYTSAGKRLPISSKILVYPNDYTKPFKEKIATKTLALDHLYSAVAICPFDSQFWQNHFTYKSYDLSEAYFTAKGYKQDFSSLGEKTVAADLASPYRIYKEERLNIEDLNKGLSINDFQASNRLETLPSQLYNLDIHYLLTFLDTGTLSRSLLDKDNSYYFLEPGPYTEIALNLYIDIFEKHRLAFDQAAQNLAESDSIEALLKLYHNNAKEEAEAFFEESRRGRNLNIVLDWNEKLAESTGLNNLQLLEPNHKALLALSEQREAQVDLYNLGTAYLELKRYPLAIRYFKEELKLNPKQSKTYLADLYLNLGLAFLGVGNKAEACNCFYKLKEFKDPEADKLLKTYCENKEKNSQTLISPLDH